MGHMKDRDHFVAALTAGILILCVCSFWVGLNIGFIPCSHRCYWCGKALKAQHD